MSATIGAALKKIAVALFTNPKVLKTVLGIVLGIVIALITPILAVIAVFNGGIKLDTEKLQQMITENLSAADQAMPDPLCGRFMRRLFLCIRRTIWTGASMNLLSCPL